jgi:hypothetical protein
VHFRAALFDDETSDPGNDDFDIEAYYSPNGCTLTGAQYIGSSAGLTSEESIDFPSGPAGTYIVFVDLFAASNGTDSNFRLWLQTVFGDESNTAVSAPASAVQGSTESLTVDYTGLASTRYLGILHHMDGNSEIARTILDIDAR